MSAFDKVFAVVEKEPGLHAGQITDRLEGIVNRASVYESLNTIKRKKVGSRWHYWPEVVQNPNLNAPDTIDKYLQENPGKTGREISDDTSIGINRVHQVLGRFYKAIRPSGAHSRKLWYTHEQYEQVLEEERAKKPPKYYEVVNAMNKATAELAGTRIEDAKKAIFKGAHLVAERVAGFPGSAGTFLLRYDGLIWQAQFYENGDHIDDEPVRVFIPLACSNTGYEAGTELHNVAVSAVLHLVKREGTEA